MSSTHYSCQILIKLEFSQHIFLKYSNIKYHEYLYSGSQAIPCGQMDGRMETDMMKLTVTVCNFLNAPKKYSVFKSGRRVIGKKIEEIREDKR